MSDNHYDRVPTHGSQEDQGMPSLPPSYDDLNHINGHDERSVPLLHEESRTGGHDIEEFEIDDLDYETYGQSNGGGFLSRASALSKSITAGLHNTVIKPISKMVDPINEGLGFINMHYEQSIMKIGNPLVVKRLLYVSMMVGIIFFVSKYSINDGVNGSSGGAFSSGKLFDIQKLADTIKDHIDEKTMLDNLEYFSSMPHVAGTSGDLALTTFIHDYMKSNGIHDVETVELQSYINYPASSKKKTRLRTSDETFEATLNEFGIDEMEYIGFNPNALNTDSELEGHLIYANKGSVEDFQHLTDANVDLKDSILLIEYGGSLPEPLKLEIAAQKEVKAVIFITPKFQLSKDNLFIEYTDVIQRLNVGNSRFSTGDILTPGWSSEDGYVSRLPWFKSKSTPKVPSHPVSYQDGLELIKRLANSGYKFSEDFYSGTKTDDPAKKVKLSVGNNQKETHKLWNVVGSISGREQDTKSIIIGSSRDSSCFGTVESNSGSVVFLEIVKILTTMQRQFNWVPARTIKFISFDATNYNLAGLTEWIEEKKNELKAQAYAYFDLSDAVAGSKLSIQANPFLHNVIRENLKKVSSPSTDDTQKSLYDLMTEQNSNHESFQNSMLEEKNYIPFINLLNIPSVEIKFSGDKDYPLHSCYDNFKHFQEASIDPTMTKHGLLVHLLSRVILDVVESPVIPFKFSEFADRLVSYKQDLENYVNEAIKTDTKPNIPQMHFDHINTALNTLKNAAVQFDSWVDSWKKFIVQSAEMEPPLLAIKRWKWNDCLVEFNAGFLSQEVQPSRPGYMNMLFGVPYKAPPKDDNRHQWNTFPRVREYIEQGDFGRAQHEIDLLATIMENISTRFTEY